MSTNPRYDIVALVSNDLVTDQRMQRCLTTLTGAGYRCLLLGRERPSSKSLDDSLPFDQERLRLSADSGKAFYYQLMKAHRKRLIELRPRAILAVDLDTVRAAAKAAKSLGIPWVLDAHELFTEQPEVAARPWIKAAWSLLGRRYVPTATAAYTVGDQIASILTDRYGLPFETIRNYPVALDQILRKRVAQKERATSNGRLAVLYQGAVQTGRGLEELIQAATDLPQFDFWIAGGGYALDSLKNLAASRGVANVQFFGVLLPRELRGLTPQADIGYALMEKRGLNYYLSLSNKSIDYVQAGLPSLQMDWPEYSALHDEFGCYHLIVKLTPKAIVQALLAVAEPNYYEKLKAGCSKAALRLTWESQATRLVNLWAGVLG